MEINFFKFRQTHPTTYVSVARHSSEGLNSGNSRFHVVLIFASTACKGTNGVCVSSVAQSTKCK